MTSSPISTTVLVVDDDPAVLELIRLTLRREGFETVAAHDGASAIAAATSRTCHLVVLDLLLPGMSGLEVFRRLRADARTARLPVIMLSGQSAEAERVQGLELGADDYVTKPFSTRELVARIRAVLRRALSMSDAMGVISHGRLYIDVHRHDIRYAGQPVQLTACEFRVLHRMASSPGIVLSREQLGSAIDETYASLDRTIDAHIKSIRRKLGAGGDEIETVRGFGYRLRAADGREDVSGAMGEGVPVPKISDAGASPGADAHAEGKTQSPSITIVVPPRASSLGAPVSAPVGVRG